MRKLLFIILVLFFSIISIYSFAGTIKGKVIDAANNSPLSGVIVNIKNTDKGMPTDIDGNYEFKDLADGKYEVVFSMITYNKITETVTIKGNNTVTLDVKMKAEGSELKTVTVQTGRATHTEASVVLEMRKSSSIVSGISAAQIQKTMDRNAADVVKRIPGVTIQDDRFIIVRGLPDRYNTVWLNDASSPSSEIDKKSFSFDMIPAGLIDRIMVYKTPSPELPGDFAGGMIKVYTTSIPEVNSISAQVQVSMRSGSTGSTFNYNPPSSTDKFGYDDGMRSLPGLIPDTKLSNTDPNINAITKAFPNNWIVNNKTLGPDGRFNFAASNVFHFRKWKLGNTFGLAYTNISTNYDVHRQEWTDTTKVYNYNDKTSENKVSVGLVDNIAAVFGNNKIEWKNLYSQIGKSSLLLRNNIPDPELQVVDERSYSMTYESRAVYSTQLCGTHTSKNDDRKYNWALGYTDLFWNQPDLRRIVYNNTAPGDSVFYAQISRQPDLFHGGSQQYSQLFEKTYSFNHQFTQKIHIDSNYSFDISAGNFIEYKSREYGNRQFGYTIKGPNAFELTKLPINEIFADSNVGGPGKFLMGEGTHDYDKYSAKNTLIASFVSLKFPIGSRINIVGGVRYEVNDQSLVSYINGTDTLTPDVNTKFLLPSVNASYNITEKSLLRVAYGKTLNRPEFREWAPVVFYDFDDKSLIYGSLNPASSGRPLDVAEIQNIDARWEWYPSAGELIHAGVFYKSFTNPIQRVILGGGGGGGTDQQVSYANVEAAYSAGIEIDIRKNLAFADNAFNTNVFKNFAFVGNLSIIKSEISGNIIGDSLTSLSQVKHTPLQGQSPYVVNLGLFYQNDSIGFQGSLLYNVCGPRMYALGTTNPGQESLGELPFGALDMVLSKTFYKHYIFSFGIQNLLDAQVRFLKDTNGDGKFDTNNDKEYKSYKPGRYFSIGLKVKF